jgi:hypothetical protein
LWLGAEPVAGSGLLGRVSVLVCSWAWGSIDFLSDWSRLQRVNTVRFHSLVEVRVVCAGTGVAFGLLLFLTDR